MPQDVSKVVSFVLQMSVGPFLIDIFLEITESTKNGGYWVIADLFDNYFSAVKSHKCCKLFNNVVATTEQSNVCIRYDHICRLS